MRRGRWTTTANVDAKDLTYGKKQGHYPIATHHTRWHARHGMQHSANKKKKQEQAMVCNVVARERNARHGAPSLTFDVDILED